MTRIEGRPQPASTTNVGSSQPAQAAPPTPETQEKQKAKSATQPSESAFQADAAKTATLPASTGFAAAARPSRSSAAWAPSRAAAPQEAAPADKAKGAPEAGGAPAADAKKLIEDHHNLFGLNLQEEKLGQTLAQKAVQDPAGNLPLLRETFKQLSGSSLIGADDKNQVAMGFMKSISDADLKKLASTPEGKAILDCVKDSIRRDGTTLDEAKELGRIGGASAKVPTAAQVKEIQDLMDAGSKDQAIKKAIEYYGIDTSKTKDIKYDSSVSGDAVTSPSGSVRVGDEAFRNPAWLASSIGHECEVHVNQQAKQGKWYDGKIGTPLQEVQAYDYEIANAKRYGTSDSDLKDLVARRKEHYDSLPSDYKKRADAGNYDMKPGEEND